MTYVIKNPYAANDIANTTIQTTHIKLSFIANAKPFLPFSFVLFFALVSSVETKVNIFHILYHHFITLSSTRKGFKDKKATLKFQVLHTTLTHTLQSNRKNNAKMKVVKLQNLSQNA